ncbi:helicase [Pseudidiomarina insulisalsae]|uniref:DNA 3'-5' helicase II n=2 Tax=Pseudidiomarina insulisalsae TaxID=575789 RepID=A0A432YLC7_9GAMM|nr:helicase [Pseudidiomarina insulisalsae]
MKCDALLVTKTHGLVAFDLVEGSELGDYVGRQDALATMLEVKLKPFPELKNRRELKFSVNTVTFAPIARGLPENSDLDTHIASEDKLLEVLDNFQWNCDSDVFSHLIAAIQLVTSLRGGASKRHVEKENSLGARLKKLEETIANLDQHQSEAVIESVDGVQRIRGLAGSGKTIVLALKASYLHAQNPDWKIAVTFNTRSLKEQFKQLINNFTIEQTGTEPDWERLYVMNAWGAPGIPDNDGMYHRFCLENECTYFDYQSAKYKFGNDRAFERVCELALTESNEHQSPTFDAILVDEAQDFPSTFLRLCYESLKKPKRLVYAYDELQNLNGTSMAPPEDIFGTDKDGNPKVTLDTVAEGMGKQDIILDKCYRNSRPVLTSAHALGFGIYRNEGLIQLFDQDKLWEDVGYTVTDGVLAGGEELTLERHESASPAFLETHSKLDELIDIRVFEDKKQMNSALVSAVRKNVENDELRPQDILVINPDPFTTKKNVGPIRGRLAELGISSELAGVSTSRDVFKRDGAITFTGIYRAKGNEAGMVYVINAQDCNSAYTPSQLALARNRLFTAITRSKAWVRVWGFGPKMEQLKEEWLKLKDNSFRLRFRYPTIEEKSKLRLINKDISNKSKEPPHKYKKILEELSVALERGDVSIDEVPEALVKQIKLFE